MLANPYQEKAQARPIEGRYKELAIEVRRLLGWDKSGRAFVSTRTAARKTELSNGTIASLANGDPASMETVLKFARGVGGDIDKLLLLAGYDPIGTDPLARLGANVTVGLTALPLSENLKVSAGDSRFPGGDVARETLGALFPPGSEAIRVDGECLEPFIRHGDIVVVMPQSSAESGQKVIAQLDDDTLTCKIYRDDDTGPHLEAVNGQWPRIPAERFRIVGVVIKAMRDV